MHVLVTGATGFIGRVLGRALEAEGHEVRRALQRWETKETSKTDTIAVGILGADTDWSVAMQGIEAVVHLAARVPMTKDIARDPGAEFRRINVTGTEQLAKMAAIKGVRRFVYLSTIKVNGEETVEKPFTEADPPHPEGAYAVSKWEAEQVLHNIAANTGLEIVIIRSPMVYGPGVKGNFARLLSLVDRGLPLPLGSAHNRRSLIGVENLASLMVRCVQHPLAAGEVFLAADGEDLSVAELVKRLAKALGRSCPLFPCSPYLARAIARLMGRENVARRLFGALQVDSTKARQRLGWSPPVSVDAGLSQTANWYVTLPQGMKATLLSVL